MGQPALSVGSGKTSGGRVRGVQRAGGNGSGAPELDADYAAQAGERDVGGSKRADAGEHQKGPKGETGAVGERSVTGKRRIRAKRVNEELDSERSRLARPLFIAEGGEMEGGAFRNWGEGER